MNRINPHGGNPMAQSRAMFLNGLLAGFGGHVDNNQSNNINGNTGMNKNGILHDGIGIEGGIPMIPSGSIRSTDGNRNHNLNVGSRIASNFISYLKALFECLYAPFEELQLAFGGPSAISRSSSTSTSSSTYDSDSTSHGSGHDHDANRDRNSLISCYDILTNREVCDFYY